MDPIIQDISGDPADALRTTLAAIEGLGYRITPGPDGWSGRAEVGSAVARAFAGGFSRRMILDYRVETIPTGARLIVMPASTGWSGGALGASKAKKELAKVADAVAAVLGQGEAPPLPPPAPPS